MRYNSPSKQKFTLLGWTMGWIEWLILVCVLAYGAYDHFASKPKPISMSVPIEEVAAVFGPSFDSQDKSVDIWATKFKLEFDAIDNRYRAERELRFFEQTLLQRCLLKTASTNSGRLSDSQVADCQTSSAKEAAEAQAYWNKK
jgi:hypothetical protein